MALAKIVENCFVLLLRVVRFSAITALAEYRFSAITALSKYGVSLITALVCNQCTIPFCRKRVALYRKSIHEPSRQALTRQDRIAKRNLRLARANSNPIIVIHRLKKIVSLPFVFYQS